ncbi:MAG TPA: amidase [Cyclobacteriaceae bacterium]|nr:amidase [Cyclobacteriaceae bacterium]
MKQPITLLAVVCMISMLTINACKPKKEGISVDDVRGSEKLIGIEFNDAEIDTMLTYIEENRAGYDSMRKFQLHYETTPALYFDPRPHGFERKVRSEQTNWKLPSNVVRPEHDDAVAFMTIPELAALLRSGQITSTELTKIYLERIRQFDDSLKAVITITEDLALAQAEKADQEIKAGHYRSLVHGIPYGIKDLFSVPGYKTTWGAAPYKDQQLNEKAVIVSKLEDAGAVLIAKLTSGALARGDVWFGGKTKNPWDLKQGASGSSAGSGSATSAGLVAFSIGTETLGSIISPSTRCGVTGLRPTFGAVSRAGGMSLSWSMDKAGPICRSAQDCAIVFSIIKGKTGSDNDRSTIDYEYGFDPPGDLTGYKIGYFKELFDNDTTKVGSNNKTALSLFRQLGASMEELSIPKELPYDAFDIILRAEAGAFFDELVRNHGDRKMVEQGKSSRANSLRQSRFISAVEYLQANRFRTKLIEEFYSITKDYDLIISPTFGSRQSLITNLTGNPAISIPTGIDSLGHPTSITLLGNLYDEKPLVEAAFLFQQASEYDEMHPKKYLVRN